MFDDLITSAYDLIGQLDVEETIADPFLVENAVQEKLEGEEAFKFFFRTIDKPDQTMRYEQELVAPGSEEVPEDEDNPDRWLVAEAARIPLRDPRKRAPDWKYVSTDKFARGIDITWEQEKYNRREEVQQEIDDFTRLIKRMNSRAVMNTMDQHPLEEFPVDVPWDQDEAKIYTDFNLGIELLMSFGYFPTGFWANPITLNRVNRNEEIQKKFIGNMASENPIFKKISQRPLLGGDIQQIPDEFMPVGVAYLGVEQRPGFMLQNGAPYQSPWYAEFGDTLHGGSHQVKRSDYEHFRDFGMKAPKSILKLTNLSTPIGG